MQGGDEILLLVMERRLGGEEEGVGVLRLGGEEGVGVLRLGRKEGVLVLPVLPLA